MMVRGGCHLLTTRQILEYSQGTVARSQSDRDALDVIVVPVDLDETGEVFAGTSHER